MSYTNEAGEVLSLPGLKRRYPEISFGPDTPAELGWTPYSPPPAPPPPEPTYDELRRRAYKPVAEQLDMQYWDSVNGTTLWFDHVASVKALYPKPVDPLSDTI